MIALERVSKTYRHLGRDIRVFRGLTATLPAGRHLGILGRRQSGKSTLLRLLAGLEAPDSGMIRREARVSFPLGYARFLDGRLNAVENIRFVARVYGVDAASLTRFVREFSELAGMMNEPVAHYDAGMRQRLAAGLWLGLPFDCRLVDQVPVLGSQRVAEKLDALMQQMRRRSWMIFVASKPQDLRGKCRTGAVLARGKLAVYGDLRSAISAFRGQQALETAA